MDDKFALIEAEFGLKGFAVIVKLFQRIYGQQGYYCEWTNEVALLFGRSCGLGDNVVSDIVAAAIRRGIFDKDIFEKYQVLTSAGIQRRYLEAVSRRKIVEVKKQYLLLRNTENFKNVHILSENVNISSKNDDSFKQRKKEREKESKESSVVPEDMRKFNAELQRAFDNSIRPCTRQDIDVMSHLCGEYSKSEILQAIETAKQRGGHSAKYVESILQGNAKNQTGESRGHGSYFGDPEYYKQHGGDW